MRILIVAHYFPPLQSVGSLRPSAWVRHWRAAGHQVHVLTTRKTVADGLLDPASSADVAGDLTEVPYASWLSNVLDRRARRLREDLPDHTRPFVESRSTIRWLKRKIFGNYLDFRLPWIGPAVEAANRLMQQNDYDAVVSTAPPFPAHMVASELKLRHSGLVWIADYRDLWSGSHLFPGIAPVRALERWQERRAMSSADMVSTVSEPLAVYLRKLLDRPVTVYPNGFERIERPQPTPAERARFGRVVAHTGTIYETGHDVDTLLRALQSLAHRQTCPPDKLRVRFYGETRVLDAALDRHPGASAYVDRMGSVPRAAALSAQALAEGLIFLDWVDRSTDSSDGILSGKLFEYLASGTEILVIGAARSSLAGELVTSCGAGTCFGTDHLQLADALERIALRGGVRIEPQWDRLAPYDRRTTSLALLDAIGALVSSKRELRPG